MSGMLFDDGEPEPTSEPGSEPEFVPEPTAQFTAPYEEGPPPPPPPGRPRGRAILAAVLAGLLILGSGVGLGWSLTRLGHTDSSGSSMRTDTSLNVQALADHVDPAVVDINTYVDQSLFGTGLSGPPTPIGAGTGMIVTPSGELLTNNHVIQGSTSIRVTIAGRPGTFGADVIGADPSDDVALLKIRRVSGLPTVTLADSSDVSVGDQVVAIGNALGQGGTPTVTAGAISALERSITVGDERGGSEHLTGVMQTDAPVSPGESGGPLVNGSGEVIGIITASARSSEQDAGNVAFAIPTNHALDIVRDIRAGHDSSSIVIGDAGFLGVQVRDVDSQTAARLGPDSGALVVDVVPGTPAESAGLTPFSVITEVDGQHIGSADDLGPALHAHDPGDQVRITWLNGQGTHSATVTLVSGPAV